MIDGLKPYPAMKESGVPWLGPVPEHWDIVPNRALMRFKKEIVGGAADEYTLLSLTKGGIIPRDMDNPEGKFPTSFDSYQVVEPGDLVFCLFDIDETPRTVGLSLLTGMITGAYSVFACSDARARRFIYWLYLSLDNGKLLKPLYSGLRKVITKSTFLSAKLALPPPPERLAIVRYLDYIDRRVRRYIRAKQKLIELLEEQKQAIIHRAVTRGLDPDVPLKPSGVQWLGDVPEHWDMVPNRVLLRLEKQLVGDAWGDHVLLSLTKRGVIPRDMENPEGKFPSSFDTYQEINPGDLLFCLFDIDETPRAVGLSSQTGMVTGAYTRFSCDPSVVNWVYLFYLAMDNGKRLKPLYTGLRKVITKSAFLSAKMPLPPPSERDAILAHVKASTRVGDESISAARREIELVREYHTRLIADVVTGKLDVREAAANLSDEPDEIEPLEQIDDRIDEGVAMAEDLQPIPEGLDT